MFRKGYFIEFLSIERKNNSLTTLSFPTQVLSSIGLLFVLCYRIRCKIDSDNNFSECLNILLENEFDSCSSIGECNLILILSIIPLYVTITNSVVSLTLFHYCCTNNFSSAVTKQA